MFTDQLFSIAVLVFQRLSMLTLAILLLITTEYRQSLESRFYEEVCIVHLNFSLFVFSRTRNIIFELDMRKVQPT